MKSPIQVLCVAFAFAITAGPAFAGTEALRGVTAGPKSDATRKTRAVALPVKGNAGEKQAAQLLTGSRIPTTARRVGRTAETPYPIYIIDRKEIEQSGAASVAEVLRRCPAVR